MQALWHSISAGAFVLMILISGISLVVGAIVIANIMFVSVVERTKEIGLRRALGARRRDIRRQFLLESALLSSVGGLVGVISRLARRARGQARSSPRRCGRPFILLGIGRRHDHGRRRRLAPVPRGAQAAADRGAAVRVSPMSTIYLDTFRRGFFENVRFALLAIREHKLRAGLTILGIVVGVTTVIAMVAIVTGFNNNVIGNLQAFGANRIEFQKYEDRFGPGRPAPTARGSADEPDHRGRQGADARRAGGRGGLARAATLRRRAPRQERQPRGQQPRSSLGADE